MITDAIKERLGHRPFKPFELRLGSGDKYVVRHPELVSLSPGGRRLILWVGEERAVDIDLLLVETLREANGNGNGHGRGKRRSA